MLVSKLTPTLWAWLSLRKGYASPSQNHQRRNNAGVIQALAAHSAGIYMLQLLLSFTREE